MEGCTAGRTAVLSRLPLRRSAGGVVWRTELSVVTDSEGFATYIYAADLGGNVYRVSIGDRAP